MIDNLWQYSLTLYQRPGVARAAIALQDSLGADVNVLLFCCHAAAKRRAIDAPRLHDALAPWRAEVTGLLRGVRRRLKATVPLLEAQSERVAVLREHVAEVELEAERIAVAFLSQTLVDAPERPDSEVAPLAAAHLSRYMRHLGVAGGAVELRQLAVILAAAADLRDREHALALIERAWDGRTGAE